MSDITVATSCRPVVSVKPVYHGMTQIHLAGEVAR